MNARKLLQGSENRQLIIFMSIIIQTRLTALYIEYAVKSWSYSPKHTPPLPQTLYKRASRSVLNASMNKRTEVLSRLLHRFNKFT